MIGLYAITCLNKLTITINLMRQKSAYALNTEPISTILDTNILGLSELKLPRPFQRKNVNTLITFRIFFPKNQLITI